MNNIAQVKKCTITFVWYGWSDVNTEIPITLGRGCLLCLDIGYVNNEKKTFSSPIFSVFVGIFVDRTACIPYHNLVCVYT